MAINTDVKGGETYELSDAEKETGQNLTNLYSHKHKHMTPAQREAATMLTTCIAICKHRKEPEKELRKMFHWYNSF